MRTNRPHFNRSRFSQLVCCTDVLHLSEHEAYLRITVARAARDHPALLEWPGHGRLTLSAISRRPTP